MWLCRQFLSAYSSALAERMKSPDASAFHIGLKSHRQPHVGAAKSPMVKKVAFAFLFTLAIALLCAAVNAQQFPIMDRIADKVIQKYQTSTCEQLWQERAEKGKA